MSRIAWHDLVVGKVVEETYSARSIFLDVPDALMDAFRWQAGQYLTIEYKIEGKVIRRAYSICTSPQEQQLGFTVKRIDGGRMSTYLTQVIAVGDRLKVMTPQGRFVHPPNPEHRHIYHMIAAGSGITPIYSLIKSWLEDEPLSTIYLLYGNRTPADIIYREALDELVGKYAGQLYVEHVLSKPQGHPLIPHWHRKTGRIGKSLLQEYLDELPEQTGQQFYFICGPGDMIDLCVDYLLEQDTFAEQIFTERFQNQTLKKEEIMSVSQKCKARIKLDGETFDIDIADETVLQTLIDEGYDPPYSCTSGVCTTCMAKLTKGKVEMEVNYGLSEDEVEEGYILTCQSRPTTDEIELTYDI